jgi:hypothetical protein
MPRKEITKDRESSQAETLEPGVPQREFRRSNNPASGAGNLFESNEIAERAYQIFEREGRIDGRDMDHWLQAERELRSEREKRQLAPSEAPRSARQHQQGT